MHLPTKRSPPNAAGVLFQVAQLLVDRGRSLLRGEVLGPRGQLFKRSPLTALYAASPVYLPEDFAVCPTPEGSVVLTWLVPITGAEAAYVESHGWQTFEDSLLAEDPDLTDLSRSPLKASADHLSAKRW